MSKLDQDELRRTTRELRALLDRIEETIDQAQTVLSEVEEAAGLVMDGGRRDDE